MPEENAPHADAPKRIHKGVYILPNLLTTASLFAGFLGMIWALDGDFDGAAMAILFAAFMDGLDGKVARLTNTASEFGVQYDSLADLAAFGIAPALVLWQWHLQAFGRLGMAAAFVFAVCGALRLARFTVSANQATTSKKFFPGLPIPAAGSRIATFILFQECI
ncbi:MAG: CDP-diacylglycerol--serine O-phosphatidyltransferase, partial [Deltaproteobacteria bacterium]|nr:CDP-diacylglycerol--serine O-phosphatidyltransferase [Deltaproteobacteria bacterium]